MAERTTDRATQSSRKLLGGQPVGSPRRAAVTASAAGALLAALALTGCASGEDRYCGTGLAKPEFGDATREFWPRVTGLPETVGNEFVERGGRVWDGLGRVIDGRGREWNDTSDHVAGFGPWLGGEFEGRTDQLTSSFSRAYERAADDSCCFFERAWHGIKLAIE